MCHAVYVLSSSIHFELCQVRDVHSGHLKKSRWRPDSMSVVRGTNLHMKLNITKYMCANFRALVITIF